jgi:hypothetical protein
VIKTGIMALTSIGYFPVMLIVPFLWVNTAFMKYIKHGARMTAVEDSLEV